MAEKEESYRTGEAIAVSIDSSELELRNVARQVGRCQSMLRLFFLSLTHRFMLYYENAMATGIVILVKYYRHPSEVLSSS